MVPPVRIGTRASKLAVTQSGWVARRVAVALGFDEDAAEQVAPLTTISTAGDRIQDRRLIELGGKALFTKEIELALLDGRVDLAVHSMKDVPADIAPGTVIAAVPEREDPRDAFVSAQVPRFDDLPHGARLGTASQRRQAQALRRRPDLAVVLLRGNVDTRLAKIAAGEVDAALLAAAGLRRLGLQAQIRETVDPWLSPPAPGQGALAIQCREADAGADWLRALHHAPTALAVAAERGALEALEGNCRTAIGAYSDGERLVVEALSPGGTEAWRRAETMSGLGPEAARALGERLGREIAVEAGDRIRLGG